MEALVSARLLLQDTNRAEGIWKTARKSRPRDERFLRRLFFLYHDLHRSNEAAKVDRPLLEVNPFDYAVHGRYAHVPVKLDRISKAIEQAEIAVQLNPSSYEIYEWLSQGYIATGDKEKSDKNREICESLRVDATRE